MATFENSWKSMMNYGVVNDTASNASKNELWAIKAFLTGQIGEATSGLWTVISSSDGTSAADSDLWGSTFDASKLNRAASGSAHSWIVLRSSHSTPVYLTFDYCSTQADSWFECLISYTAPTGGTATTRPTATDGVRTQRSYNTTYYDHQLNGNDGLTPGQLRIHGGLSSNGDFWILGSKDGDAKFTFAMFCITLADTKANDMCKTMVHIESYRTAGLLVPYNGSFNSGMNGIMNPIYYSGGDPGNTFIGSFFGRTYDGSASQTALATMPGYLYGNTEYHFVFAQDGAWPSPLPGVDAVDGFYDDFPIYLIARHGSGFTLKGRLVDFRWCGAASGHGRVEPVDGPPFESMTCGAVWIPGVASAPIL